MQVYGIGEYGMTELSLNIRNGKLCYDIPLSRRDCRANATILYPSLRMLTPMKHVESCIEIENDVYAFKMYRSNRGVPTLLIYDLKQDKVVAVFKARIPEPELLAKMLGIPEKDIEVILENFPY